MELRKIKELLEKYFEARTTSEEERLLSDYFSGSKIPEELSPYKALFAFYKTEGAQGIQPAQQQPIKNKALEAILAGEQKRGLQCHRMTIWNVSIALTCEHAPTPLAKAHLKHLGCSSIKGGHAQGKIKIRYQGAAHPQWTALES